MKILKILKVIGLSILYIPYALLTQNARLRYFVGKNKGMYCSKIEHNALRQEDTYTYHPNIKPFKEYSTFKEFISL